MPARYLSRLALVLLLAAAAALAAPRVSVLALFPGKALLGVAGERHLLAEGESTPQGVRLVSADPQGAVVEIDGRRHQLGLNRTVGGDYQAPSRREVRVARDSRGMFVTAGAINGQPVSFMVDTGASLIAMNEAQARRLGLDYRLQGTRIGVETASGPALAYRLQLDRVRVGSIELADVTAAVIEGGSPRQTLLGMSFLGRVNMTQEGSVMVLRAQ